MRGMKKHILRAVVALIAGAVAVGAMTFLPIHQVHRGHGARITTIFRGTHVWANARDEAFGLAWSNLQLLDQQLLSPVREGELPAWAEPPPPPYPDGALLRIGTLASGWPFPALRMRWTVTTTGQNFPVPAELDDQDTSIAYAAEDFTKGNRGGGPQEIAVLWRGALANLGLYATTVWVLLSLRATLVTRRAGAAAAR